MVCLGLASTAALADAKEPAWVELTAPTENARILGMAPIAELRGRAGTGEAVPHDVVIALDVSWSVLLPTGSDVDGDGVVGEARARSWPEQFQFEPENWTTDYDDTVLRAELLAIRRLVERLDPETARVGVVTFRGTASRKIWLGSTTRTLKRLNEGHLVYWGGRNRGGTDHARALHRSIESFHRRGARKGEAVQRSIILVSDGEDDVDRRHRRLVDGFDIDSLTDEAAAQGIRVYTFGMGETAAKNPVLLQKIAERTNGRYIEVAHPAAVVYELPWVNLVGLAEIEITNLRSGEAGRAVRLFPDGTFDGYAPLVEGTNVIRVRAVMDDGQQVTRDRSVTYSRPPQPTPEDARRAELLLEQLRARTLETELADRARSGPARPAHREVEVQVED